MAISHGLGKMSAQSISIQASTRERCNGGCEFCISRTTPNSTGACSKNIQLCDMNRLEVGLNYAHHLGATHSILTGKADPTQEDSHYICDLIRLSRKYVPLVDMHTNGYLLVPGISKTRGDLLKHYVDAGLTMITLSIASFDNDSKSAAYAPQA